MNSEKSFGFYHFKNYLSPDAQQQILTALQDVIKESPFLRPTMPGSGTLHDFLITNCGELGWVVDRSICGYQKHHPVTGQPWAAMPTILEDLAIKIATKVGEPNFRPQTCLISFYDCPKKRKPEKQEVVKQTSLNKVKYRSPLHQDISEINQKAVLIAGHLGDDGIFALGGANRFDPIQDILVQTGDITAMSGSSRHFFHGFKYTIPDTSQLLKEGGRLNFTIRMYHPYPVSG